MNEDEQDSGVYRAETIDGIQILGYGDELVVQGEEGIVRIPTWYVKEFASLIDEAANHCVMENELWEDQV